MSFLSDLGDFITGKSKSEISSQAYDAQKYIAEQALKNQIAEAELKYSPELSKQRTRQIAIISISLILIIGIILYATK